MKVTIEGVEIELTQEQVRQIEAAKKPSPEERFWELMNGCEIRTDFKQYPDSVFFFKGDRCWFELEKDTLWCAYNPVWSVFEIEYGMKYEDIQRLVKNQVEQHFKMTGVTPRGLLEKYTRVVEQHFKLNNQQ